LLWAVCRVTTHQENLEKSGNSKVVKDNEKSQGSGNQFHLNLKTYVKCTISNKKIPEIFCGGGTAAFLDPIPTGEGTPLPKPHPSEATTVDHCIKQYIDESLPVQLEKSGNLVLWKVVTLCMCMYQYVFSLFY